MSNSINFAVLLLATTVLALSVVCAAKSNDQDLKDVLPKVENLGQPLVDGVVGQDVASPSPSPYSPSPDPSPVPSPYSPSPYPSPYPYSPSPSPYPSPSPSPDTFSPSPSPYPSPYPYSPSPSPYPSPYPSPFPYSPSPSPEPPTDCSSAFSCPADNTCCEVVDVEVFKFKFALYGCCPRPNAVCCGLFCCPQEYPRCAFGFCYNSSFQFVRGDKVKLPWKKKTPALNSAV